MCGRTLIGLRGGIGVSGHGLDDILSDSAGGIVGKHKVSNEIRYCSHVSPCSDAFTWAHMQRRDGSRLCINFTCGLFKCNRNSLRNITINQKSTGELVVADYFSFAIIAPW